MVSHWEHCIAGCSALLGCSDCIGGCTALLDSSAFWELNSKSWVRELEQTRLLRYEIRFFLLFMNLTESRTPRRRRCPGHTSTKMAYIIADLALGAMGRALPREPCSLVIEPPSRKTVILTKASCVETTINTRLNELIGIFSKSKDFHIRHACRRHQQRCQANPP